MFELLVYCVAVLLVLVVVGDRPQPVPDPEEIDLSEIFSDELPELIAMADRLELLSIYSEEQPVQWDRVSDRQMRALCDLHGVRCNKRGRLARVHFDRLREVAA